ncbi:MAG: hypothetical protein PF508_05260 [Spirochaeta sp.]|jgi:aryl-alcohol dehydrogenase-like predicted oxidoreductase|nr:hypothetical protein [Spirochaeta sp.]
MGTTYSLGKTDLEVTPIGLGCWQFSRGKGLAVHSVGNGEGNRQDHP